MVRKFQNRPTRSLLKNKLLDILTIVHKLNIYIALQITDKSRIFYNHLILIMNYSNPQLARGLLCYLGKYN